MHKVAHSTAEQIIAVVDKQTFGCGGIAITIGSFLLNVETIHLRMDRGHDTLNPMNLINVR